MLHLKFITVFWLLIIALPATGQINITFLNRKDSTLFVFGSGWDNKIRVNNLPKGAKVEVSQGLITKINTNEFVIHRLSNAERLGLKVVVGDSVVYSLSGKVVRTEASGTEYNPVYKPRYDKVRGLYIPENDSCRVVRASFAAIPKKGDLIGPYLLHPSSESGRNRIKEYIAQTNVGTKIFFDEILVRCPCDKLPLPRDSSVVFTTIPATY